jgi:two-component system, NtrC family, sensor kinase
MIEPSHGPQKGLPMENRLHSTVADLRRQLAASNAERDEALAREAAVAEVLQVINLSTGDLAPVFDAILEKAMRLCNADQGVFFHRDGEVYRPVAQIGLPPQFIASTAVGNRSVTGQALARHEIVHVADVAADQE